MANKIESFPKVEIDFTPKILPIKRLKDKSQVDIRYGLINPFAFAHIYWDKKTFELVYEIEEPILNEQEAAYKEEIISAMGEIIN